MLASLMALPWKVLFAIPKAVKFLIKQFMGFVVIPIWKDADRYESDVRRALTRWRPLVPGIEYQIHLESVLSNLSRPRSFVKLKNVGTDDVRDVKFSVVAKVADRIYPDPQGVDSLPAGVTAILYLDNVPLRNESAQVGKILISYDKLEIKNFSMTTSDGRLTTKSFNANLAPTNMEFLNPWLRRHGKTIYNVKTIEDYITHRQHVCHYHLVQRVGLMPFSLSGQWTLALKYHMYGALPFILLNAIASSRGVASACCWFMLVTRQRKIKFVNGAEEEWWDAKPRSGK